MKHKINEKNIPRHVAIIMDGNGRWAKQQGEERTFGHVGGVESVRDSLKAATEIGVKYLTLYAFSSENWNRPKNEVDALMNLLVSTIANEKETLNENGVCLKVIGDRASLPDYCKQALSVAEEETSSNDRITLVLALSYSARWEITNAVKEIVNDSLNKKLNPSEINEEVLSSYMATFGVPDPDLLIPSREGSAILAQSTLISSSKIVLSAYTPPTSSK